MLDRERAQHLVHNEGVHRRAGVALQQEARRLRLRARTHPPICARHTFPSQMSTTLHPVDVPTPESPAPEKPVESLATLRAELDRLDEQVHDTLMRRAEVVAKVGALKGGVALRPGRGSRNHPAPARPP